MVINKIIKMLKAQRPVWLPSLVSATASAFAILVVGGLAASNIVIALISACAIVLCAWWVAHLCSADASRTASSKPVMEVHSQSGDYAGLEQVYDRAAPIWSKQIELACNQTEESILNVTSRFSAIVERLQTSVAAAQQSAGGQSHGDVDNCVATVLSKSDA